MHSTVLEFTQENRSCFRFFGFKDFHRFAGKLSPRTSTYSTKGGGSSSPELTQKLLWSPRPSRKFLDYLAVQHLNARFSGAHHQTTLSLTSVIHSPTHWQLPQNNHVSLSSNLQVLHDHFSVAEGDSRSFRFSSGRSEKVLDLQGRGESDAHWHQGQYSSLTKHRNWSVLSMQWKKYVYIYLCVY